MIVLDGPWETWDPPGRQTAVTVGVLDGVHLGHRSLLRRLDHDLIPTVLTFDPHPIEVLRPGTPPRLITTLDERLALLDGAGVAMVGVLDLDRIRGQSPRGFVEDVMVGRLDMGRLVVGEDFRFGKDRSGDVPLLRDLGAELGFVLDAVRIVADGDAPVSSSRIRELIGAGDVAAAARLMGSRFTITNEVVAGDERGRELGFPTANLRPPDRKLIPARGVYACFARVDGQAHQAAVNVGIRPMFSGDELLIEAYLLDFGEDLYGKCLTVEFVEYLRPELSFESVATLVESIAGDVEETRRILAATPSQM
ncbi:MAG: bifunctional riboflavin kinase/FAD synthetase [Acidimicrobiia bacterium]